MTMHQQTLELESNIFKSGNLNTVATIVKTILLHYYYWLCDRVNLCLTIDRFQIRNHTNIQLWH